MKLSAGKNIRLFENEFLEKLTYVHPILPIGLWGPIIFGLVAHGLYQKEITAVKTGGFFLLGLGFWSLAEYVLHRYVFHFKPKNELQKRIAFLIHGVHHEDPADQRRLLMPPAAAVLLAAFFYCLFLIAFGSIYVKPFFAGFLVGYLVYDYIHFATHYINFQSKFFKDLKRNHMLHHFKTPNLRYGVSSTFWDKIFGSL